MMKREKEKRKDFGIFFFLLKLLKYDYAIKVEHAIRPTDNSSVDACKQQ